MGPERYGGVGSFRGSEGLREKAFGRGLAVVLGVEGF